LRPLPVLPSLVLSDGVMLVCLDELLKTKPTAFRLKDRVHVRDLDGVGLITPEIEAALPPILAERLKEIRATE
jgi:hypothetical protein